MAQMIFTKRKERTILSAVNPLAKLIALIALSFMVTDNEIPFFLSALAIILLMMVAVRLPVISYLRKSKSLIFLLVLIFITEILVSRNMALALYESGKFFLLIILSALLLDSTSPGELASSVGGVLSHICGKYAWRFSSMVRLTLTLISRIFTISSEMLDARRSRLGSFFPHPVKSISEYVLSLILALFEDLRHFSQALSARLYDEDKERLRCPYRRRDYAIIILSITLIIWTRLR